MQCTILSLQSHLHVQDFDGGKHLAHSGMNASAVYLFDRIYSLAQVSGCQKPVSSNILWTVFAFSALTGSQNSVNNNVIQSVQVVCTT